MFPCHRAAASTLLVLRGLSDGYNLVLIGKRLRLSQIVSRSVPLQVAHSPGCPSKIIIHGRRHLDALCTFVNLA